MRALVIIVVLTVSACGGGSRTPASPSGGGVFNTRNTVPTVAGDYEGTVTMASPQLGTLRCPARTTVTQSGASLNIAPIILSGQCGGLSIPFGAATIDATGNLTSANTSSSFNYPGCSRYSTTGSIGFFGRELRFSANAVSRNCPAINITAILRR